MKVGVDVSYIPRYILKENNKYFTISHYQKESNLVKEESVQSLLSNIIVNPNPRSPWIWISHPKASFALV